MELFIKIFHSRLKDFIPFMFRQDFTFSEKRGTQVYLQHPVTLYPRPWAQAQHESPTLTSIEGEEGLRFGKQENGSRAQ